MKAFIIGLLVVIAGLAAWRIAAGRVDRTKPEAVAKAFLAALKKNDVSKAGDYWVPDAADTWREDATRKIAGMRGGTFDRFFEDLSDGSAPFTPDAKPPTLAANEVQLVSANTVVGLRQIDGKWYVFRSPL